MKPQTFFPDPAVDRLLEVCFSLAAEVHVTRDRQRAMESILAKDGVITASMIEDWTLNDEEQKAADEDRDRLIRVIFDAISAV